MNKKGFASSLLIFSLLILFLITLSILITTINNNARLNSKLKSSVVETLDYDESASESIKDRITALEEKVTKLEDEIYPVGSIYMSLTDETVISVQNRFGGAWEKIEDTFLIGASSNYKVGTTGGSTTHKHESPINSINGYVGVNNKFGTTSNLLGNFSGSQITNNLTNNSYTSYYTSEESNIPPYTSVYIYKRTK